MCATFKMVKDAMKRAHDSNARRVEKKVNSDQLQVGDAIWVRNERSVTEHEGQWPQKYLGPYRILELTKTNARIKPIFSDGNEIYVHLGRTKFAYLRDDPSEASYEEEQVQVDPPLGTREQEVEQEAEASQGGRTVGQEQGTQAASLRAVAPVEPQVESTRYNLRSARR